MKRTLLILLFATLISPVFAQIKNYDFCGCIETLSDDGKYTLKCGDILVEEGQYLNEERTGEWITRNSAGQIIIKANYLKDNLDGTYEQYHFKGIPKLSAYFKEGLPDGEWIYYNDKGKVIKEGFYQQGIPIGIWKIYDKKSKSVITEFDFSNNKSIIETGDRYFEKGGIARDDISGEWMVLGFPQRSITSETQPLGGYVLAGDLFLDYLNIPFMYMNTYTHYEFVALVDLSEGLVKSIEIFDRNKEDRFSSSEPSFPFLVTTNSPGKLSRVEHSVVSFNLLRGRIKDVVSLIGPWKNLNYSGKVEIQIPFVVNDIIR